MDWGIFSFLMILFGLLSTVLNVVQLFNGVTCFDRLSHPNGLNGPFRQISVDYSGEIHDLNFTEICLNKTVDKDDLSFFTVKNGGYFSAKINFDCDNIDEQILTWNVLHLSKSSAYILKGKSPGIGLNANVVYDSGVCILQKRTYNIFLLFSCSFIAFMLLVRFLFRTVLQDLSSRLFFHKHTNWIFLLMNKLEIFSLCNPYQNFPLSVNEDDHLYEFTDVRDEIGLDVSPFSYHSQNMNIIFNYSNGKLFLETVDNTGVFNLNEEMSLGDASLIRKILENRSNKRPVVKGNHCLTVEECLKEVKKGKGLILSNKEGGFGKKYLYGVDINFIKGKSHKDRKMFKDLKEHMQRFFGFYSKSLFEMALKGHYYRSEMGVKNSEWKLYLSDIYFHYGLNPDSRSKKFKPSKAFLSEETPSIVESLEKELELNDFIEEKRLCRREGIFKSRLDDFPTDEFGPEEDKKGKGKGKGKEVQEYKELVKNVDYKEDRKLLTDLIGSKDGFQENMYIDFMRDYKQLFLFYQSKNSQPSSNRVFHTMFKKNAKNYSFGFYKDGLNTLNWIKENGGYYRDLNRVLTFCSFNPKPILLEEEKFNEVYAEYNEYTQKIESLYEDFSKIFKTEAIVHYSKEEVDKAKHELERNKFFRDKEKKAARFMKYDRSVKCYEERISRLEAMKEEVKSEEVLSIYKSVIERAKLLNEDKVNLEILDFQSGITNSCIYYCAKASPKERDGSSVRSAPEPKAIKNSLRKCCKDIFSEIKPSIENSIYKARVEGFKPSINKIKFDFKGKQHFLPKFIKMRIKAEYKKYINSKKEDEGGKKSKNKKNKPGEENSINISYEFLEKIMIIYCITLLAVTEEKCPEVHKVIREELLSPYMKVARKFFTFFKEIFEM